MDQDQTNRRRLNPVWRAVVEVALIMFILYSIRLMGEFTATNGPGKSLAFALSDILTRTNFVIAMISALIGFVVIKYLRKQL